MEINKEKMNTLRDYCKEGQEYEAIELLKTMEITEDEASDIMSDNVYEFDCSVVMGHILKRFDVIPDYQLITYYEAMRCLTVSYVLGRLSAYHLDDYVATISVLRFLVDVVGAPANSFLCYNECNKEWLDFLMKRGANDKNWIGAVAARVGDEELARKMLDEGADRELICYESVAGQLYHLTYELITDDNKEKIARRAAEVNNFCIALYLLQDVEAKEVAITAAQFGNKEILDLYLPFYDDYAVLHANSHSSLKEYLYDKYKEC